MEVNFAPREWHRDGSAVELARDGNSQCVLRLVADVDQRRWSCIVSLEDGPLRAAVGLLGCTLKPVVGEAIFWPVG